MLVKDFDKAVAEGKMFLMNRNKRQKKLKESKGQEDHNFAGLVKKQFVNAVGVKIQNQ